jgi:threonyl-tRNA synthetase
MASAVLEMFPEAKFAIGPSIENGFYYDFDLPRTLIPEDLEILEEKMKERISATVDEGTIKTIDEILKNGKYRNKSHVIETAIKLLLEK